jgi:hypothetical protein
LSNIQKYLSTVCPTPKRNFIFCNASLF